MIKKPHLITYWITFPDLGDLHRGFGVTAYSLDDAFNLLKDSGSDYHQQGYRSEVTENVSVEHIDHHVKHNMGPKIIRGVWYPFQNL